MNSKTLSKKSKTSSKTAYSVDKRQASWFQKRLLRWFAKAGRHDLPWQHPRTPYRVWLSEVMLQQTQVTTVIPYFQRFIDSFPTLESLAAAEEDTVLALWAGLGYYARARNLHKTAKILCADFKGIFPEVPALLETLPGIGRSTACAIVAQSYNTYAPILDGNVKRVLTRLHCVPGWPDSPATQKILWPLSERYTPEKQVADYTQAIMDLGATLCKRSNPACEQCPLQERCEAFNTNEVKNFPHKKKRAPLPIKQTLFLTYRHQQKIWLERRPTKGIWGGLWCLPETNVLPEGAAATEAQRHTFTHYHLDYQVVLIRIRQLKAHQLTGGCWYTLQEALALGVPAPIKRLLETFAKETA